MNFFDAMETLAVFFMIGFVSAVFIYFFKLWSKRNLIDITKTRKIYMEHQIIFAAKINDGIISCNKCGILALRYKVAHYNTFSNSGYLELWIKEHDTLFEFPKIFKTYMSDIDSFNSLLSKDISIDHKDFERLSNEYHMAKKSDTIRQIQKKD